MNKVRVNTTWKAVQVSPVWSALKTNLYEFKGKLGSATLLSLSMAVPVLVPLTDWSADTAIALCLAGIGLCTIFALWSKQPLERTYAPGLYQLGVWLKLVSTLFLLKLVLFSVVLGDTIQAGRFIEGIGRLLNSENTHFSVLAFGLLLLLQRKTRSLTCLLAQCTQRFTLETLPEGQMRLERQRRSGRVSAEKFELERNRLLRVCDVQWNLKVLGNHLLKEAAVANGVLVCIASIALGKGYFHGGDLVLGWQLFSSKALAVMAVFSTTGLTWALIIGMSLKETRICYLEEAAPSFPGKREVLTAAGWLGFETFALSQLGLPPGTTLALNLLRKNSYPEQVRPDPVLTTTQHADPYQVTLKLGRDLLPLVDPKQGAKLTDLVAESKMQFQKEFGFPIQGVRILDCLNLEPAEYSIQLHWHVLAQGRVEPGRLLAMGPSQELKRFGGRVIREPVFDIPACWVDPEEKGADPLESALFAPHQVIATHLLETLRRHASALLTVNDVKHLLSISRARYPGTPILSVQELTRLTAVFSRLLEEQIPLTDLSTILSRYFVLKDQLEKDTQIADEIRLVLARATCERYCSDSGVLHVLVPGPAVVSALRNGMTRDQKEALGETLKSRCEMFFAEGLRPLFMTERDVRRSLHKLVAGVSPHAVVLCWDEVYPGVGVNVLGPLDLPGLEIG